MTLPLVTLALILGSNTWYVDGSAAGPGNGSQADPYVSIQAALDAATTLHGDTVLVLPGLYNEDVAASKSLTVRSTNGALETVIEAVQGPAVLVGPPGALNLLSLEGFTVRGATSAAGVFVSPSCEAIIVRCIVSGNATGIRNRWDVGVIESTLAGNSIAYYSDNFAADWSSAFFRDSIVHANVSSGGAKNGTLGQWPNFLTVTHSVMEPIGNYVSGPTVLHADPLFWIEPADWQTDDRDFHLRPGSPAIGAGSTSRLDLGALPYDGSYAPMPAVYCTPKTTAEGCLAHIGFSGTVPSASAAGPFFVTAQDVPANKSGVFFFGLGAQAAPFQNGWLCVAPPVQRTPVQFSGSTGVSCSGGFAFDLNAAIQAGASPVLLPGVTLHGQYWFRDPGDPFQTGLSDALTVGIAE